MSHGGEDPAGKSPECSPGAAPPGNGISEKGTPEALLRGYTPGKNRPGTPRRGTCDLHPNLRLVTLH